MKKIISLILMGILFLGFTGCSSEPSTVSDKVRSLGISDEFLDTGDRCQVNGWSLSVCLNTKTNVIYLINNDNRPTIMTPMYDKSRKPMTMETYDGCMETRFVDTNEVYYVNGSKFFGYDTSYKYKVFYDTKTNVVYLVSDGIYSLGIKSLYDKAGNPMTLDDYHNGKQSEFM